jgi:hypothetical protein
MSHLLYLATCVMHATCSLGYLQESEKSRYTRNAACNLEAPFMFRSLYCIFSLRAAALSRFAGSMQCRSTFMFRKMRSAAPERLTRSSAKTTPRSICRTETSLYWCVSSRRFQQGKVKDISGMAAGSRLFFIPE